MKTLSIIAIALSTLILTGCGTETKLMNDAYTFDGSTYDYIKEEFKSDTRTKVKFGQGGRNCIETWNYENGSIVSKEDKHCSNYKAI